MLTPNIKIPTMKKQITIKVADNSGCRRKQPQINIWRNNIEGMEPGSLVTVYFYDDYTVNRCRTSKPHAYQVVGYKFDDEYAKQRNRHTVTLRKVDGGIV